MPVGIRDPDKLAVHELGAGNPDDPATSLRELAPVRGRVSGSQAVTRF